jgi:hypothetical protein
MQIDPSQADPGSGADVVHHPGITVGEWVRGIVLWETSRRTVEPGDLLHATRSPGADCSMEGPLQHGPATQLPGVSAASPRGDSPQATRSRAQHWNANDGRTNLETGTNRGGRSSGDRDRHHAVRAPMEIRGSAQSWPRVQVAVREQVDVPLDQGWPVQWAGCKARGVVLTLG